jgi:hypothetical protein
VRNAGYPHSPGSRRVCLQDPSRQGGKKAVMNHIMAHSVDLGDPVQRADAERQHVMMPAHIAVLENVIVAVRREPRDD